MDPHWARFFGNLTARMSGGPLHFRLIFQPAVALFLGIRDGMHDAREGRKPFLWTILTRPSSAKPLLGSAFRSMGKIFIVAIVLDAVYQVIVNHWFYPGEAVWVAFVLAFWPYVLVRGPAERIASLRQKKLSEQKGSRSGAERTVANDRHS